MFKLLIFSLINLIFGIAVAQYNTTTGMAGFGSLAARSSAASVIASRMQMASNSYKTSMGGCMSGGLGYARWYY